MKTKIAKIVGALAIALGLTAAVASGGNEGSTPSVSFSTIALGNSGGFAGTGNGKALRVEADGNMKVKDQDKQKNGKLKPDELEKLKRLVASVNWEEVKPSYNAGADMFMSDLSVTIGGKERATSISDPRPDNVPKNLASLLDFLNELHGSYKP